MSGLRQPQRVSSTLTAEPVDLAQVSHLTGVPTLPRLYVRALVIRYAPSMASQRTVISMRCLLSFGEASCQSGRLKSCVCQDLLPILTLVTP